jgi:hypothetical protein
MLVTSTDWVDSVKPTQRVATSSVSLLVMQELVVMKTLRFVSHYSQPAVGTMRFVSLLVPQMRIVLAERSVVIAMAFASLHRLFPVRLLRTTTLVPLATMGRMLMAIASLTQPAEISCASWDATAEPVTKPTPFVSPWYPPAER